MDLVRIAHRIIHSSSRKISLETILNEIHDNCPSKIKDNVGKFLGAGHYGEAYEIDGGDRVLKISIAKSEIEADKILDKVRSIDNLNSDAFVKVYDYGILCDVDVPNDRYMVKSGIAYFYIMERLLPLSTDEKKVAARTLSDLSDMTKLPNYEQNLKKYLFSKGRQYKRDGDIEEGKPDSLSQAVDLFNRMRSAGAGHRDAHGQNIMQNTDGQYKMIDLEQAELLTT